MLVRLLVLAVAATASAPVHAAAAEPNVVDAVVRPLLARAGFPYRVEDESVLCRRMAIDLTGLPPTPAQRKAGCAHRTPRQMATYFMELPHGANVPDGSSPYVFVNRRWWADHFQYRSDLNTNTTWWAYVRELDALVGRLYAGTLTYDEFTRQALRSPAFARRFGIFDANHDLVQIAAQAYRVFLGREALPPEAEDLGNLWRGWSTVHVDHALAVQRAPADCPRGVPGKDDACQHTELVLDEHDCRAEPRLCRAPLHGGASAPGDVLVARREWAEHAVDDALVKYLGWWKKSWFIPDQDLAPVRTTLVAKLVRDRYALRPLELEIVTSVLYTGRAAAPGDASHAAPPWAYGPTKMLYGEAYLDMAMQMTGGRLDGGCDFRFSNVGITGGAGYLPGYWYKAYPISARDYQTFAQGLGGCPIGGAHQDPSGWISAITRRAVAAALCPGAFHPASGTSFDALLDLELAGTGWSPAKGERAGLARVFAASHDVQPLAAPLCEALLSSAPVLYY